jgi:hypothetical protein
MKTPAYLIFLISGLSFRFYLAFPFANYHESSEWIAQPCIKPKDYIQKNIRIVMP